MAGKLEAKLSIEGDRELKRFLDELPKAAVKRSLRKSATAAIAPIVRSAKALVAVQSKALKKSLTRKVKSYSQSVVAIAGANRAAVGEYHGKKRVPAKYIHLVERGHGGPHPAPPHPFLHDAYQSHKGEAEHIATAKMKESLEEEAKKLGAK